MSRGNTCSVCGIHFPDGRPTKEHPYPVLYMGYDEHEQDFDFCPCPTQKEMPQPLAANISKVTSCGTEPAKIGVDFNNQENIPPQNCDAGVQWPDPTTDHNYFSKKSTKDSATQTDPAPSFSAFELDNKDCRFFTGNLWLL